MPKERLSSFRYNYQKGPRFESEAEEEIEEGNCRLALQDYFLVFNSRNFRESELLNPEAYLHTGIFLKESPSDDFFGGLQTGTVIYAERVRKKNGDRASKSRTNFSSKREYLVSLHSAIYIESITDEILKKLPLGILCVDKGPAIWHATAVEGGTCLWSTEKFLLYYKPVAAKSFATSSVP